MSKTEIIMGNEYITKTMNKGLEQGIKMRVKAFKVFFTCMSCNFDVARIINFVFVKDKETLKTVMISKDNSQAIKKCPNCRGQILAYVVGGDIKK